MAKTKFETLIEHIINDEQEAARELFHDIVVEKSREIYNNLVAEEEEDMEESIVDEVHGEDATDDMSADIEADEAGMDADEMGDDAAELGDEMGMDHEGDDMDHEGGDELEDRVVDLEAALDELKAEFDSLMADEAGEEEHSDMEDADSDEEEMPEGMVREYVEKVAAPAKGEGQTVGSDSSSKPAVNAKSVVAGKNDMGGTTANIAKGGANAAPDGKQYSKPSNQYSKGSGNLPGAGSFENVPGAKAGSTFGKAQKPVSNEVAGTNDKSPLAKG